MEYYLIIFFASLVGILIAAGIFRLVFNINRQIKLQEGQVKLLREIALKLDAPKAEINDIYSMATS